MSSSVIDLAPRQTTTQSTEFPVGLVEDTTQSTEFPVGLVEDVQDEEYGRRRVEIPRNGDFITGITLHTPGVRVIDTISSVQVRIGGRRKAGQSTGAPVMWEGSPRTLKLRNLCEDVPRTEDPDNESMLFLSVCGDICDGEGIPYISLQFSQVFVSIKTAPGVAVHLSSSFHTEPDSDKRFQLSRVDRFYDSIQLQQTEIVLDSTGACVDEPLPFYHHLAYLVIAFRGEDDDVASISSFDDHPTMDLALSENGGSIRRWVNLMGHEQQQMSTRRLPCGAYVVNTNAVHGHHLTLTISLSSNLSRGKISVVAMNRVEFRCKYGLCGMWHTSVTPAVVEN
jgi:hypothetical protein